MGSEPDLFLDEIKPDLTPLIDAIFLLLIFFMVSMVFAHPEKLKVDLAAADHTEATRQEQVRLSISREGQFELMGRAVTVEQLSGMLREYRAAAEDGRLTILVDRRATHGYTLEALEAAAQCGFTNVYLATRSKQSDH